MTSPSLLLVATVLVAAPERGYGAREWSLSFDGFGPVKVGMTVPEAEKALNMRLGADRAPDETCHYVLNEKQLSGVGFMVLEGRIARIDVSTRDHPTWRGARVGATEAELRRLHPQIAVNSHPYDDRGHDLRLASRDRRRALIFETDGQVVTSFRAGMAKAVAYIEGCE
jgi:hypothetical protein